MYDALKIVLLHARRAKDDDAVSDFILLFDHVSSNTSRFLLAALALRKLHAERALQVRLTKREMNSEKVGHVVCEMKHAKDGMSAGWSVHVTFPVYSCPIFLQGMMEDYEFEDSIRQLVVWSKSKTMKVVPVAGACLGLLLSVSICCHLFAAAAIMIS